MRRPREGWVTEMKHDITTGDKYGPAMKITDQEEAKRYFEECIEHSMARGNSRAEADRIERSNLGYWAGYYDNETRERVERLFHCAHPVFGPIALYGAPTPEEAFEAGVKMGEASRKKK